MNGSPGQRGDPGQPGGDPGCDTGSVPPPADGNVASRLSVMARLMGPAVAIAQPTGRDRGGWQDRDYRLITFRQLDDRSTTIARGLSSIGIGPGRRIVMLVPFGAAFIELVFALLKTGAEIVLIDPGIDRRHLIDCLSEAHPDGFVGIAKAQWIRRLLRRRFPDATLNVTVGLPNGIAKCLPRGRTLQSIEKIAAGASLDLPRREHSDPAAIIFTTGSTGPPKGVAYTHGTFHAQIDRIRDRYGIRRGSRDLACFPLFGLFDAVMGVTTIIPDMDPTRPADVDPRRLIEAARQWECDQAFGSPALWKTVVDWADHHVTSGRPFGTLTRVLSAGAPVPVNTLSKLRRLIHPDADIHTPYGATEALPIASIESRQIITRTGPAAAKGKGVCVGTRFDGAHWKVIQIDDRPIENATEWTELPAGKIGELVVSGPMVTTQYKVRGDQNAVHKVADGDTIWHRMGDVGYIDEDDQFWFCGRKAHRVVGVDRTWFTIPCEAIFAAHADINRAALVGRGECGQKTPVMIAEPHSFDTSADQQSHLLGELRNLAVRNPITRQIEEIRLWPRPLPVDIRHNSKIFRERLANELIKLHPHPPTSTNQRSPDFGDDGFAQSRR